jgi:SM-20-related protein
MTEVLDLDKLEKAEINKEFFPYCQVDCFIKENALAEVLRDFPKIKIRGSIPAHRLAYGLYFQKLLDELYQIELRSLISQKFAIDLSNSHTMLTVRGQTNLKDGFIHTDTSSKLMTLLLYLNEDWGESTGNLRLLKDNSSLENYFAEIIPTAGKLLVFKVTDNCWHGHYPFIGKRQTLQLNYVINQSTVNKEMKRHSFSYTLKKLAHFISRD